MGSLFTETKNAFSKGHSFALAMIISHKGSTPRRSGSWVLIWPDIRWHGH
ncbi:MAG: XdhC family protein [Desulfobacter postgatei]|nr:XdhC family protein [Desulfobacter postgatei]MDD4272241.1 XdhC family protein [Desulfobacter postgatei]MDX9962255.1 XdhC family protein [Desulfobacter postgatei]